MDQDAELDLAAGGAPTEGDLQDAGSSSDVAARRRAEDLQSVTDVELSYMSLEEMLSEMLEGVRARLAVDTAAILLLDEDRGVLVARAARGLEEEVRQGVRVPLARGFAGRVAAEHRPIVIEDLSRADVFNPILRQRGIRSMVGVPLQVGERVIGVMHVGTLEQRAFTDADVAALQFAADGAALAIDGARLSEQRATTEVMQRALLPDALPVIPGLRFSAKYLPGGSGVKIGGDWYDVFQLAGGRIAFVIGDVVGRGVIAASVMAEIRVALRAYTIEGHELTEVVSLLNRLLVAMGQNRGATALVGGVDLELGRLQVVSAGHLPALIIAPDGSASFIEAPEGLPLGVRAKASYGVACHPFPVGSGLLLYTDGLIERRDEPIDAGMERLRRAGEDAARSADSPLADSVYRALIGEAPLEDDIALLAIESVPLESEMELTLDAQTTVLTGLRRVLGRWLAEMGASEDELFDLALAASEAAANAVEHAYGARQATFSISCRRTPDGVTIQVTDFGRWRTSRPYGRGRGLIIMRALVDSVELDSKAGGTRVTISKRLVGSGG